MLVEVGHELRAQVTIGATCTQVWDQQSKSKSTERALLKDSGCKMCHGLLVKGEYTVHKYEQIMQCVVCKATGKDNQYEFKIWNEVNKDVQLAAGKYVRHGQKKTSHTFRWWYLQVL